MTLEDFLKENVLFAVKYDGLDLTTAHGTPARTVCSQALFMEKRQVGYGHQVLTGTSRFGRFRL